MKNEERRIPLLEEIEEFELDNVFRYLGTSEYERWIDCQTQFWSIMLEEESYWQQKARLKWFLESDINTNFFFMYVFLIGK